MNEAQSTTRDKDSTSTHCLGASTQEEIAKFAMQDFENEWQAQSEAAQQATDVMDLLGTGTQLSTQVAHRAFRALVTEQGWGDLVAAQRLLAARPDIRRVTRVLGRGGKHGHDSWLPKMQYSRRARQGVVQSSMPPMRMGGLTTIRDISQALPHLRATLLSPNEGLKCLGLAKLAEGSLQGREYFGFDRAPSIPSHQRWMLRPRGEAGPVLVCLDTSGSMTGNLGVVARAAGLEAARQALGTRRPVFVLSFGGEGELELLRLDPRDELIPSISKFLRHGFGSSTNIEVPIHHCLKALQTEEWKEADILLISDGDFESLSEPTAQLLAKARSSLGLRLQGLLVQKYESPVPEPMRAYCDAIHVLSAS